MIDNKHLTGITTELYVAYYFSDLGWDIYWPLKGQSRDDFVISKNGFFKKIQVKKATWSKAGGYEYLQCRLKTRNKNGKTYNDGDFHIIVFVDDFKNIWIADWEEVKGLVSVCLLGTKSNYSSRSLKYNPDSWKI